MAKGESIVKMSPANKIEEILDALGKGAEWIQKAGELYVELIAVEPQAREDLKRAAAARDLRFSSQTLNWLEGIGRHQMHRQLFLTRGTGQGRLISRLPFSDQKAIFEDGKKYPLLLPNGDDILVDLREISHGQAAQIFGDGYIRDLPEQKSWLLDNKPQQEDAEEIKEPYVLLQGFVDFLPHDKKLRLSKARLREILMQI